MKYLGILLVVALVFVGSVAMANSNVWCELKGTGWSGNWGNIYFNVKVEPYIEVSMSNDVFLWHIAAPQPGTYESNAAQIKIRVNYNNYDGVYRIGYTGFKNPTLKEGASLDDNGYVQGGTPNTNFTVHGWWQFLVDNSTPNPGEWIDAGQQQPGFVKWIDIPSDGDYHYIYVWTKIEVPNNPVPKAGLYTDTDINVIVTPEA